MTIKNRRRLTKTPAVTPSQDIEGFQSWTSFAKKPDHDRLIKSFLSELRANEGAQIELSLVTDEATEEFTLVSIFLDDSTMVIAVEGKTRDTDRTHAAAMIVGILDESGNDFHSWQVTPHTEYRLEAKDCVRKAIAVLEDLENCRCGLNPVTPLASSNEDRPTVAAAIAEGILSFNGGEE
jgi:hypothetical protein